MDSSCLPLDAAHINKHQVQPYLSIQQQCWLLQQPCDSGYAEGNDDLFSQAFKSYEANMQSINQWVIAAQNTPALTNSSSAPSPFEYADSLVLPPKQWQPYEASYSTAYCLDGPAAYNSPHYHKSEGSEGSTPYSQDFCQSSMPTEMPALQPTPMEECVSTTGASSVSQPRQREHHTAVEQRYRKNLNDQFNSLRLAVPDIQTSQPQRAGQPARPSKCEVLAGAVDYIKRLEDEVRALKINLTGDENEASRKRARTMI
ncbi:hypothetical protein AAFC00_001904 [Neodothiora populina]|uniref:BHLH domain-containing protein n=1 Tax=Neodothiora populina TaxID=2781224 RepID=A0ABR3PRL9_9PEZI